MQIAQVRDSDHFLRRSHPGSAEPAGGSGLDIFLHRLRGVTIQSQTPFQI